MYENSLQFSETEDDSDNDTANCKPGSFSFKNASSVDEARGGLSNLLIIPKLFLISNAPIVPKIIPE